MLYILDDFGNNYILFIRVVEDNSDSKWLCRLRDEENCINHYDIVFEPSKIRKIENGIMKETIYSFLNYFNLRVTTNCCSYFLRMLINELNKFNPDYKTCFLIV